jgi:UDP-N-acetyl-D-mannosaminuronic acid dehydrogenase
MSPGVAVVGLGRIGLPLAISFADRGLRVLGIDKDAERLQAVRDARMPFEEPGA